MTSILFHITALASLAATAAASPAPRQIATTSKTFTLVINVTDSRPEFANIPLHGALLGTEHVGAGHTALVPSTTGAGVELTYTHNRTIQDGLEPNYWEAFYMGTSPADESDALYGIELIVGADSEFAMVTYPTDANVNCLGIGTPAVVGTFAICDQGFAAPEAPQYSLWFSEGVEGDETLNVPDSCVAVSLLPQCAASDEFDDSEEVLDVFCYEDVASIDWSLAYYQNC